LSDVATDTSETRVARGAALLDEKLPGWDRRIDLDNLHLGSKCDCVLGQEFANDALGPLRFGYDVGLVELFNGDEAEATRCGFLAERSDDGVELLTAEWKRLILARRGGAS